MIAREIAAALLISGSAAGAVGAQVFEFRFPIDGSQMVPPTPSPATGEGYVRLDVGAGMVEWEIHFRDLTGAPFAAHFHGPAPRGAIAPVRLDIGSISGVTSPMIGSAMVDATMAQEVIDGLWYFLVHTPVPYLDGEIRGQVVDEPPCFADCDGSGDLDFFDFLCFQNQFAAGDPQADCDASGALDFFDFLCFQNAFAAGCS